MLIWTLVIALVEALVVARTCPRGGMERDALGVLEIALRF